MQIPNKQPSRCCSNAVCKKKAKELCPFRNTKGKAGREDRRGKSKFCTSVWPGRRRGGKKEKPAEFGGTTAERGKAEGGGGKKKGGVNQQVISPQNLHRMLQ